MQKHSWLVLNFHRPISENTNTEINTSKQKPRRLIPPPLRPSPPSPCLELLDVGAIRAEQALPSPRQLHCFPGCRDSYGQVMVGAIHTPQFLDLPPSWVLWVCRHAGLLHPGPRTVSPKHRLTLEQLASTFTTRCDFEKECKIVTLLVKITFCVRYVSKIMDIWLKLDFLKLFLTRYL